MAYTHITPGWEIEVSAHYYPDKKADRVAELIQLPREELAGLEKDSVQQEEAIFAKFSSIEAEWRKQAAETIAIRKAREYLRALPVEHTSNQWKVNQFGWNVLSNMVYDVKSSKIATSVGVESIVFYTEDGDYVTSVSGSTRNGLVKTNNDNNAGDFKYDLPSGKYYYAEVTVFARVGSDYDSRTVTTSTVWVR